MLDGNFFREFAVTDKDLEVADHRHPVVFHDIVVLGGQLKADARQKDGEEFGRMRTARQFVGAIYARAVRHPGSSGRRIDRRGEIGGMTWRQWQKSLAYALLLLANKYRAAIRAPRPSRFFRWSACLRRTSSQRPLLPVGVVAG